MEKRFKVTIEIKLSGENPIPKDAETIINEAISRLYDDGWSSTVSDDENMAIEDYGYAKAEEVDA